MRHRQSSPCVFEITTSINPKGHAEAQRPLSDRGFLILTASIERIGEGITGTSPDGGSIIRDHFTQPMNSSLTGFGMIPASYPRCRSKATASRPRGPKSIVQSLTYMPTNLSDLA